MKKFITSVIVRKKEYQIERSFTGKDSFEEILISYLFLKLESEEAEKRKNGKEEDL